MSKRKTQFIITSIIIFQFLQTNQLLGQEEHSSEEDASRHRLGLMIGHTHIPLGFNTPGERNFLVVPTWGLSYDFRLSDRWAIGVHTELETATYVVEQNNSRQIERERPFKVVLATAYNPWKQLVVEGGFGRELETHASFWVFRLGVAYEIEIGKDWDLAPGFILDFKEDVYTSWTIGLQVGKMF